MRVAPQISLSTEEAQTPEKLARGRKTTVRLAQRSSIILLAAQGRENQEIAQELGVSRETVGRWRRRYAENVIPRGKELHLIADNYATHKQPAVKKWLAKHPRFHMHYTPTSASWLNMGLSSMFCG